MNQPAPVLERLRAATAAAHKALESQLDAIVRLSVLAERRVMVARYFRMHASADAAISNWLAPVRDLDSVARRRTPVLAEDMALLGLEPSEPAAWPALDVAGRGEALGLLYVLEGSTLGGRMIHKALRGRGCDLVGLSFLDPYGARTGERWRSFLDVLEREGAADPAGVERGGVKGFQHAEACLTDAETVN